MARKIKFALEMADGTKVRSNLEELREHFDLESIMGYYLSGKLQEWLEDRYYEKEAEQLAGLNKDASDIYVQVCNVLSVKPPTNDNLNIDSIERLNQKKALLRQVTTDENIIEHAAQVAFNQEELADLIESDFDTIYICGEKFTIPTRVHNKNYIGVNKPQISINVKSAEELEEKSITIQNALLPDSLSKNQVKSSKLSKTELEIQSLSLYERTKQLYGKEEADAEKLYLECKYDGLLDKFLKLSNEGVERANYFIVQMYNNSYGDAVLINVTDCEPRRICYRCTDILAKVQGSYICSKESGDFENFVDTLIDELRKMADEGDPFACFEMDGIFQSGYKKITQDEANSYINKSSDLGNVEATFWIARRAEIAKDYNEAVRLYEKASKAGHPIAQYNLGYMYEHGIGVNKDDKKAFNFYSASANKGLVYGQKNLADCYYSGKGTVCDTNKAAFWYQKAAEKDYAEAQNMLGVCYANGYGVEQDYETAYFWYDKAAEKGDSWGQYNQGEMHINKFKYWWDYKCAWADNLNIDYGINLLNLSIKQGNVSAMKLLADYYKKEADDLYFDNEKENIKELYKKAQELYNKAADNGNKEAIEMIENQKKYAKAWKLRAIYHSVEFNESDSLLFLERLNKEKLEFMGVIDWERLVEGVDGIQFLNLDYKYVTSQICKNEFDLVYACTVVYIDSKKNFRYFYDLSTMWGLTTDYIVLHDAKSLLVKVEKSFLGSKEKVISDITIHYNEINNVEFIQNKELCITFNSKEKIKLRLNADDLGCWNQAEKIARFLSVIKMDK